MGMSKSACVSQPVWAAQQCVQLMHAAAEASGAFTSPQKRPTGQSEWIRHDEKPSSV
jgi:hypothetical protein